MTTPAHRIDESGYDDLTPYLQDLARTMAAENAREGSPSGSVANTATHGTGVPAGSIRGPARPEKPVLQKPAARQVRFTLAVRGSAHPFSLGALVILIGVLVTVIAV